MKTKTLTVNIRKDLADDFKAFLEKATVSEDKSAWIEVILWHFLKRIDLENQILLAGDFKVAMKEL